MDERLALDEMERRVDAALNDLLWAKAERRIWTAFVLLAVVVALVVVLRG